MTARDARLTSRELGARELAGYRVLRSLARDEHAEVLLGHRSAAPENDGTPEDAVQTVAIKVFAATDEGWHRALHECAALDRARGDHVVELLDLDADDESIRMLFERLPRGDLAELLRIRLRLEAGEAVTLLAPIAVTLLRMHAAGVAHGKLSPGTVLFRDDGSPTLIGFSGAELFEPRAPEVVLERVDAVGEDRSAARSLAIAVLARVVGGRARAARELLTDIEGCDDELVLPLLASRLFEVAAALPVRFAADDPEVDAAAARPRVVPVSADGVEGSGVESGIDSSNRPLSRLGTALGRIVPEPLLQRVLDTVERSRATPLFGAAAGSVGRRWRSWTPGRRRVVLAVGAAALTVGVVTAVVPSGAEASGPASSASPTAGRSGESRASASTTAADGAPTSDPAVRADDPQAAAISLVAARAHCLSTLSVMCLDRVDEPGSAALDDDRAVIRASQKGAELPDPLPGAKGGRPPVLIERLGDSALVQLGDAASAPSLLLVKGDAGWRIRDVIAADAPAGQTGGPSGG